MKLWQFSAWRETQDIRKLLSTLKDKAAALNAQKDKVKKKDREVSL